MTRCVRNVFNRSLSHIESEPGGGVLELQGTRKPLHWQQAAPEALFWPRWSPAAAAQLPLLAAASLLAAQALERLHHALT